MKIGDIDNLLENIDGNFEEKPASGEGSAKEKEQDPPKKQEPLKDSARTILSQKPRQTADLSFLENIDRDDSKDEDEDYERRIKEELSLDQTEITGEDSREKLKDDAHKKAEEDIDKNYPKVNFIIRGTRTWNTREPYVIQIDKEKLKIDYKDLLRTFFLVRGGEKEQNIQGEMRRSMFKFVRDPGKNIIQEYTEYISDKLFGLTAELGNYFGFQKEQLHLFIYHLGALTLYKIIILTFQAAKIGYCFKLLPDNNVVKYIPLEFVKEVILKWHNENINSSELVYDGIIEYNELKRQVSRRYTSEYEKYNSKLDDLLAKSNANISLSDREQIFKSKWDDWFGKTNIAIYNRFLERTIFKMVK
jgi:hypothetical protein